MIFNIKAMTILIVTPVLIVILTIFGCSEREPFLIPRNSPLGSLETLVITKSAPQKYLISAINLPASEVIIKKVSDGLFSRQYLITTGLRSESVVLTEIAGNIFSPKKYLISTGAANIPKYTVTRNPSVFGPTTYTARAVTFEMGTLFLGLTLLDWFFSSMEHEQKCCEAFMNSELWRQLYPPGAYYFSLDPNYLVDWHTCKIRGWIKYRHPQRSKEEIEKICEIFEDCESVCNEVMGNIEEKISRWRRPPEGTTLPTNLPNALPGYEEQTTPTTVSAPAKSIQSSESPKATKSASTLALSPEVKPLKPATEPLVTPTLTPTPVPVVARDTTMAQEDACVQELRSSALRTYSKEQALAICRKDQ